MTISPPVAPPDLRGAQQPRVSLIPECRSSTGVEAVELARMAGLELDPWQQLVLEGALGERADGRWAAFEVGVLVPRQNGKGAILEARELAGLFLLGERLIIHSAHQFDTSLEAFRRLLALVEDTPDLARRVKRVSRAHGEEGIELKSGQRIRFRTRTKGGGRGFTGDCLILDEAMDLPESALAATLPTLSARPNPQVWYTASAVDQQVHDHGLVLARVRDRGLAGEPDGRLAYFEWSPDATIDTCSDVLDDPDAWAQANPGLGIRIAAEHVANERRAMDDRTFAVERLNIGDWPSLEALDGRVIDIDTWDALKDLGSAPQDPVCFAFDVTPDRSWSSIGVAGPRGDGLRHVEVVERRRGTGWVPGRVAELSERHKHNGVLCDAAGPAASLLAQMAKLGVDVTPVTAKEHAQACGVLFDSCEQATVRHLGTGELRDAIRGATKRPLGDAWAWSRKDSTVDISPLVAVTLALWGADGDGAPLAPARAINLAEV